MSSTAIEMEIPTKDCITNNVSVHIQLISHNINIIRRDQATIFSSLKTLESKIDSIDNKINEIIDQLQSLKSTPKKLVGAKYCNEEIPDSELLLLSSDQLKRLRTNIISTKSKYKKDHHNDNVHMCDLNINKITLLLHTL